MSEATQWERVEGALLIELAGVERVYRMGIYRYRFSPENGGTLMKLEAEVELTGPAAFRAATPQ
jgi:hypothetical protein